MRQSSAVKEEDQIHPCAYCGEVAELMCSRCEESYYCKLDHQRADWKRHSKTCKSYAEKRKDHLENKRMRKCQMFEIMSRPELVKALGIINKLIESEKAFLQKSPMQDIELQIELGSSVCTHIRLLIVSKEFSTAQDILHEYFKEKNSFLSDISNIPSHEELEAMDPATRDRNIYLISGKLRLISALANLMHELIRNSVDMFEILLAHIQKVYGSDSLQLSNVYFYTANYLNFLNQSTKALACFLKSAKLRKQKGGTAYYNVALLLLKAKRKKKALQYFHKALDLIQNQKNIQNIGVIPEIYENIALIHMEQGSPRLMMEYFQKAYFYYVRHQDKPKAEVIMKLFMLFRKQAKQEGAEDMKMIQFPKQRRDKKATTNLSGKNYENFKNADKVSQQDQRKTNDWLSSFKQIKLNYNQPSLVKYPKQLQYLFGNQSNKNGEEEAPSYLVNNNDSLGLGEGVNMDLAYMRSLGSNEVGYLHELNRLLMECKERAAVYDIVENSNFYQAADRDKINRFYKLNPQLVRPSDLNRRILLLQQVEEAPQEEQPELQIIQTKKTITPKLDLTKLKQFKN